MSMDKHSFASVTLETVSGRLFLTWNDGKGRPIDDGVEPLLAREILRLARREEELKESLVVQGKKQSVLTAWIAELEEALAETAESERSLLSTIEALHRARAAQNLRQELAEKAEEIRGLVSRVNGLEQRMRYTCAEDINDILQRRQQPGEATTLDTLKRLTAAIQAGLAHAEQARKNLLGHSIPPRAMEQLDLAREALTGSRYIPSCRSEAACREAGQKASAETPWTKADHDAIRDRVAKLEQERGQENERLRAEVERLARDGRDMEETPPLRLAKMWERILGLEEYVGRLGSATNPTGNPPTCARLDSLERSQVDHAIMLTSHADRIGEGEGRAEAHHLRITDLHQRLSALEAGKE